MATGSSAPAPIIVNRPHHRDHTPEFARENFDGGIDIVHARELRERNCSRNCLNFWVVQITLLVVIVVSIVVIIWRGLNTVEGRFFQSTLGLALGIMIPNPKYKKKLSQ